MVYAYRPDLHRHRVLEGSHVGATGDGHRMVQRLGGVLTHMGDIWFYVYAVPDHRDPKNRRGLVVRGIPDAVWVNMQGLRFHNENLTGGASGSRAVMAQEPAECWSIIDSTMAGGLTVSDPYYYVPGTSNRTLKVQALLHASPHIKQALSLGELGDQLGVPSTTFVETISRYNRAIDDGLTHDPACHRPLKGEEDRGAPFYALHYVPLARKNFGGVKTNLRCQVLDKYYEPIPGLYARESSRAWPEGTLTARRDWKARCWARRCSVAGSPEPGPPAKPATARDSSARQTAARPARHSVVSAVSGRKGHEGSVRVHVSRPGRPDARRLPAVRDDLERLGFDSLWLPEHMLNGPFDPLVGLAHAAARTTRLKLGAYLIVPGRNPVRLA